MCIGKESPSENRKRKKNPYFQLYMGEIGLVSFFELDHITYLILSALDLTKSLSVSFLFCFFKEKDATSNRKLAFRRTCCGQCGGGRFCRRHVDGAFDGLSTNQTSTFSALLDSLKENEKP